MNLGNYTLQHVNNPLEIKNKPKENISLEKSWKNVQNTEILLHKCCIFRGVISRKILVLLKVNDIFLKWKFWPNYSSEFWYWCCLSSLLNEGVTPLHIYIHTTYRQWLTTLCLTSHSHQGLNHILLQFAYKRKKCGLKKYK